MNYLELCREVASQSGTIAGLPSFTTTTGATGRIEQLTQWVRNAWVDIQNERSDWLFMRNEFLAPLVIGKRTYTAAELGIADFGRFIPDGETRNLTCYDPDIGPEDEQTLRGMSWPLYRERYGRGFHDPNRPIEWAAAINGALAIGPTPDKAYMVRGEYRRSAQRLLLDTDTPTMPEQFHGLIVGEAIRLMARSDEAFQVLGERTDNYVRLRSPLVRDQTPPVSWAGETLG